MKLRYKETGDEVETRRETTTNKEHVQKQKEAERKYLRKWMLRDNM